MGDLDKIKVIICIFPAKDLAVFNFNQTNVGLLTTDMFPVDMHNKCWDGDQWCSSAESNNSSADGKQGE